MKFPESTRVVFANNPLVEVICQLSVPPQLRIEKDPPSEFQEAFKQTYPMLRKGRTFQAQVQIDATGIEAAVTSMKESPAFDFVSSDLAWKITLTSTFVSLSTRTYRNWAEFKGRLETMARKFEEIYQPGFYTRIGLRYQNLIQREKINLEGRPWSELINPAITGPLSSADFGGIDIEDYQVQIRAPIDDPKGSVVAIRHGLLRNPESQTECYLLDADFSFEGTITYGDVGSPLECFNRESGNFFRACIKTELYNALGPDAAGTPSPDV